MLVWVNNVCIVIYKLMRANLNQIQYTTMKIQIKSTHASLESAIEAAGGLNRDYNPRIFDKEVARTKKDASKQTFYVINKCGRDIVCYHYTADIELVNEFSPFGSTLSNSMTIGWHIQSDNCFTNVKNIDNCKANRVKIAEMQKDGSDLLALNF